MRRRPILTSLTIGGIALAVMQVMRMRNRNRGWRNAIGRIFNGIGDIMPMLRRRMG
jgi:hypothetical protein